MIALAACVFLSGCGSAGGDLATARSAERGGGTASGGSNPEGSDICDDLLGLSEEQSLSLDDGPEAVEEAVRRVREMAAAAPEDVADALEVFADLFEQMGELASDGEGGLDAFGEILAQMGDPEVIAASETLTEYLVEQCGVDPTGAEQQFGVDPFAGSGDPFAGGTETPEQTTSPEDPSDISLEDLDAIKDANAGSAWVDKIFSTGIGNNRSVQLGAPGPDDGLGGDPLTTAEAIEACEAVRTALEDRQPDLTVEVSNGDSTVASGAAGVPCTSR